MSPNNLGKKTNNRTTQLRNKQRNIRSRNHTAQTNDWIQSNKTTNNKKKNYK